LGLHCVISFPKRKKRFFLSENNLVFGGIFLSVQIYQIQRFKNHFNKYFLTKKSENFDKINFELLKG